MDRTERFYRIDQLLNDKKIVPFSILVEKLEVSRATWRSHCAAWSHRRRSTV